MIYATIVSFILGIVFEKFFGFGLATSLFLILIFISCFLILRSEKERNNFVKVFLVAGLFFSLGILRMSLVDTSSDQNLLKLVGQKVSFKAEIVSEPDVRDTTVRYTVQPEFSSEHSQKCTDIFLLENSSCSPQSGSQGIFKNARSENSETVAEKKLNSENSETAAEEKSNFLIILVANRFPEFQYGDQILVSGKLDLPKNFIGNNGEEFDYVSYLAKDNINFLIYKPEIEKIESGGNKIFASLYNLKNIFIEKISAVVPEPNSSFLAGIIFGAKQSLGQNLLDDFKKVGLIHIVVLSGYNITIIAAGVFFLTARFGKRNLSFIVSIISIILFSLMVGLSATVTRAAIMATIAILARFLGRPADALRWLFIAAFVMLLWKPFLIFYDPSFQLSFMATLGLILFAPFVQEKIYDPVTRFLIKIKCSPKIISGAEKIGLREIISSTLAVQIFILPLLMKMSGQFSLISFLVNPIVLPLIPATMALGGLTGGLGVIPFIGKILSWPIGAISYFVTQIIISIAEFSAKVSGAVFQIGSLSIWFIFLWYVGYGILYFKFQKAIEKQR